MLFEDSESSTISIANGAKYLVFLWSESGRINDIYGGKQLRPVEANLPALHSVKTKATAAADVNVPLMSIATLTAFHFFFLHFKVAGSTTVTSTQKWICGGQGLNIHCSLLARSLSRASRQTGCCNLLNQRRQRPWIGVSMFRELLL